MPGREIGERAQAARRIGCHRAQKLGQLMSGARIESAIGAACETRDLAKSLFRNRIAAFLEHEGRHPEKPERTGRLAEVVELLLHRIPDENQRLHFGFCVSRLACAMILPIWV